jgi:hypothetical protein
VELSPLGGRCSRLAQGQLLASSLVLANGVLPGCRGQPKKRAETRLRPKHLRRASLLPTFRPGDNSWGQPLCVVFRPPPRPRSLEPVLPINGAVSSGRRTIHRTPWEMFDRMAHSDTPRALWLFLLHETLFIEPGGATNLRQLSRMANSPAVVRVGGAR